MTPIIYFNRKNFYKIVTKVYLHNYLGLIEMLDSVEGTVVEFDETCMPYKDTTQSTA